MKNSMLTLIAAAALAATACTDSKPQTAKNYDRIATVRLTVAEGKRLIAKGLDNNPQVQDRLQNGIVIITRGTTDTYIAEELAGLDAPHGAFVTGRISPEGKGDFSDGLESVSEIVMIKGAKSDIPYEKALAMLQPEDIVFKGGNMLNYAKQQTAVNIGAPDGGTTARMRRYTDQGRGRWIVPIGLEKDTSWDLEQCAAVANGKAEKQQTVSLNVKTGDIYTEIEAIREFADVDVYPAAMGGVDGAEGGVALMICGSDEEVAKALEAVRSVLGEPPFIG